MGHIRDAFSTLDMMTQNNIQPDLVSYCVLLKSCIRRRDISRGRLIHHRLLQSRVEPDSVFLNSLIALYSKCGDWELARDVFDEMGEKRDLVSWSSMISCYAHHNGKESEAVKKFLQMLELGFRPNQFCFAAVIQACYGGDLLSIGLSTFGFAIKTGFLNADLCVGCALIDMFAKTEDLVSARKVFDGMPERNIVVWTLMITRYAQQGVADKALELFSGMSTNGFRPDQFTLSSIISAVTELGSTHIGQQLHSQAIRLGLSSDVCVSCSLLDMYAKSASKRSMVDSRKIFDKMRDHNVMSWTAIITGYVQSGGQDNEAIDLFNKMIEGNVRPNQFTYSTILKACANLSDANIGDQIHGWVVKSGLSPVNCIGNSLVSMYSRAGKMEEARKAFDFLFDKNLISCNAIFDGYSKNSKMGDAFKLINDNLDVGLTSFTFSSLLSAAASIGSMSKGQQLHGRILKLGFQSDIGVCNALVSMYSRCGDIDDAWLVFKEIANMNVISWTSMIAALAKHGQARHALELFDEMLCSDCKPNEVTYISVLSACSHVGLVKEGWEHFYSMSRDHNIIPKIEHYACMVDLLGRSGFMKEAVEIIESMPFDPDDLIWRTLLGSCRIHGNMRLGEYAAEKILKLKPDDSAAHILLSNLYAAAGQWENAAEVRTNMKQRCVSKEAGLSWMEVANRVHKFFVADTKHAQARKIYAKLEELRIEIKKMGYVPDLNCVLHEVEEEQKEKYLFQHSEKIALAFGLISTSAPRPIRIFKNLRICGDCHNAIKLITKHTGRVVVLRDSNRFHCFTDGVCSCGDHW